MSSLKKFQDEKLDIKEKESIFANEYTNISEFRNVSTGHENHLYTKLKESIKNAKAIYMLKGALKDKVDLKFYNVHNKYFHLKSYIFHTKNDSEIYIGSSNLSKGALTDSIELQISAFTKS